MMKSGVYFIKTGTINEASLALNKILKAADSYLEYKKDELVPIKLTIGDSSCVYNIPPQLVKIVTLHIKKKGSRPFLFDTSVIYKGQRQNAVDHLTLAQNKGFSHVKIGAPFIIADGLLGQDGREFKVNSSLIDKIKAPSFVGMLDSLVVLSHATGHIVSRYAASIKNVAMGMVSRSTKQAQHSSLKPSVIKTKCTACGCCILVCPVGAISWKDNKAFIDSKLCIGCGECICACKFDAVFINWHEDPHIFTKRMAEAAKVILSKFKNKFFINFALNITKECDCISTKDELMISQNVGIFASTDILSVDKAALDAIVTHKKSNYLDEKKDIYNSMLEYAAKIGLGNLEYNLIEVDI